jgi:hypothetical protein
MRRALLTLAFLSFAAYAQTLDLQRGVVRNEKRQDEHQSRSTRVAEVLRTSGRSRRSIENG